MTKQGLFPGSLKVKLVCIKQVVRLMYLRKCMLLAPVWKVVGRGGGV